MLFRELPYEATYWCRCERLLTRILQAEEEAAMHYLSAQYGDVKTLTRLGDDTYVISAVPSGRAA